MELACILGLGMLYLQGTKAVGARDHGLKLLKSAVTVNLSSLYVALSQVFGVEI